jgi:hypothetical protein
MVGSTLVVVVVELAAFSGVANVVMGKDGDDDTFENGKTENAST